MNYLFVRTYNPAYNIVISRRLREREIDLPTKFSQADINARLKTLSSKGRENLSENERLLQIYLQHQGRLEEQRPGAYGLLEMTTGIKFPPDIDYLRKLEAEIPPGSGRFVFTIEEFSQDIADFYSRYLRKPLERDLEHGETSRKISNYFSTAELLNIPGLRKTTPEEMEKAINRMGVKVLSWLGSITPELITADADRLLLEHEQLPAEHIKAGRDTSSSGGVTVTCLHESELLRLEGFGTVGGIPTVTLFLKPARGYRVADESAELGWNDFVFPWYYAIPAL